ncbi:MAG: glycosyltransferase family 39 protein [Chitinophagales bacterium]
MKNTYKVVLFITILILCYLGFLMYSNSLCLQVWDEARCALQALAMSRNNNFIVTYYQDAPDMRYLKPPMLIWIQAILFKLFSPSIFIFRLPSFVAAIGLCFFIWWYFIKYYSNYIIGLFFVIIIISCDGIARIHGAKTGEYETLLLFFTTTYLISYFQFLQTENKKWLILFFLLITSAVLTKGIQALIFTPAMFLYTAYTKKIKSVITTPYFFGGIIFFLFTVIGYYLLREYYNHGYLMAVWNNELGGLYTTSLEGHKLPMEFYFKSLYESRLGFWFAIFILIIPTAISSANSAFRKLNIYLLCCSIVYLLVISRSQTKTDWYDMLIYPLLTIIISISLFEILSLFYSNCTTNSQKIIFILFTSFLFIFPIYLQLSKTFHLIKSQNSNNSMCTSYYLHQNLKKDIINLDNCYVQGDRECGYSAQIEFYQELYKMKNQQLHLFFWNLDTIVAPCKLITRFDDTKRHVEKYFDYTVLNEINQLKVYELRNRK